MNIDIVSRKKNPLLFGNWLVDKVAILIKLENYDLKEEEKYNYCYIGYFLTFRKKSIYKYKKKKEKFNARGNQVEKISTAKPGETRLS